MGRAFAAADAASFAAHPRAVNAMPSFQAKYWVFTVNGPDAESPVIEWADDERVKYAAWQMEQGENGNIHLQGYVEFKVKVTMSAIKNIRGLAGAHLETRKGTAEQANDYATKDDTRVDGPWTFGTFDPASAGHRTDLDDVRNAILVRGINRDEVMDEYSEVYAKYPRYVDDLLSRRMREKTAKLLEFDPRPWQKNLLDILEEPPHDRKIYWVYDPYGNAGKTYLAKHLVDAHGAFYCNGGRATDITYAYNGEPIVVFDYVRDSKDYVGYGVMEQLKNGILFSTKYQSGMRRFDNPHVIVFANFMFEEGKFSADRMVTITLDQNGAELSQ